MPPKRKGNKIPNGSCNPSLDEEDSTNFVAVYECYLHFEMLNDNNEVRNQYTCTLLQYNDQVAVRKEYKKSKPLGDLIVIGRCSDDNL